jgi:hypothetical protein
MGNLNFAIIDSKSRFEDMLNRGEVQESLVVFIKDTCQIWTHGLYFGATDDVNFNELYNKVSSLENIIKKAKSCGTEVVFMTTPYSISETEMAYENAMGDILAENSMDFICGNKLINEMGIDFLVDYYDDKHTNTKGMVKVTDYVMDYLIEKYDLQKSELTDEQKQEWETAAKKWIEEVREPGIKKVNEIVAKRKR